MRRFAATTAKAVVSATAARRTFHSLKTVAPAFRTQIPAARFSSTLKEVLLKEYEEELENEDEGLDQDLVDVQKQVLKVFKIKEELGASVVKLTRKYKDETIEVKFDVQDVEMDEEAEIPEDAAEDEEIESPMGLNFEVKVNKNGHSVIFDMFASDALSIRNVRYLDAAHGEAEEEGLLYQGPVFNELAEELQAGFYEYLTERSVDDDLSFFVLAYSREKEQREYVHWLKSLKDFTTN